MATQRGQATVEWLGLMLFAALLLAALVSALSLLNVGLSLPGAILDRLVCAVRLSEDCASEPKLRSSYGADTAAELRAHAPALLYEDGMTALPIDYRRCRQDACASGPGEGAVSSSDARNPVLAFTHVVDCREGAATAAGGADCSGRRAGNLYLQYWFYYPGSATGEGSTPLKGAIRKVSTAIGKPSYHPDDWESYQVRIGPDGRRFARASAHHGYGEGWVPNPDTLFVSGGSHAGRARFESSVGRTTKDHRLGLIPLARIARAGRATFAVTPPWLKRVYRDPEYEGTD